jgi:putative inorganic carbon (hco3(-)) transporter
MLALWETFTLTHLPTARWLSDSLILGRITGLLHPWRQGSWLLQWGNEIAVFLLGLVFSIAPFVPNAMTGVVLSAVAAYWLLLSLTDSPQFKGRLTPVHLLLLGYWGIAALATGLSPVKSAALVGLQKLSLYLIFFALIERVVRSPRWRSWLITVYLLVALVVSVYGLRQWFFGAEALATWTDPTSPLANTTRVYSYLNNPNLLAGYLLPAIPQLAGAGGGIVCICFAVFILVAALFAPKMAGVGVSGLLGQFSPDLSGGGHCFTTPAGTGVKHGAHE